MKYLKPSVVLSTLSLTLASQGVLGNDLLLFLPAILNAKEVVALPDDPMAPECSDKKMEEIEEEPYKGEDGEWVRPIVVVDCSTTLEPGTVIRKNLKFVGQNIMFDCNGSKIEPYVKMRIEADYVFAITVASKNHIDKDGNMSWTQTKNVTIKNGHATDPCNVRGEIRIHTTSYVPNVNQSYQEYKNDRGPEYVREVRKTSPTEIIFDNLNIFHHSHHTGANVSVYFERGVTHSTLKNSKLDHDSSGPAIYLSAEGGFNKILNNEIVHDGSFNHGFSSREAIAIDSSEGNIIAGNWIAPQGDVGITLYRNCGENDHIRYVGAWRNVIQNNIFYVPPPGPLAIYHAKGIIVGERNGSDGSVWKSYCDDDEHENDIDWLWTIADVDPAWNWYADWESSSTNNLDFARDNQIVRNKVCNISPSQHFKVKNPDHNFGTKIEDNETILCLDSTPIPR